VLSVHCDLCAIFVSFVVKKSVRIKLTKYQCLTTLILTGDKTCTIWRFRRSFAEKMPFKINMMSY